MNETKYELKPGMLVINKDDDIGYIREIDKQCSYSYANIQYISKKFKTCYIRSDNWYYNCLSQQYKRIGDWDFTESTTLTSKTLKEIEPLTNKYSTSDLTLSHAIYKLNEIISVVNALIRKENNNERN